MSSDDNTCSNGGGNSDQESEKALGVPSSIPACHKSYRKKYSFKTAGKRCHNHRTGSSVEVEDKLETVFRFEKSDAGTEDLPIDLTEDDEHDNESPSKTELADHSCNARAGVMLSTSNSSMLSLESESNEKSDLSIESMLPGHGDTTQNSIAISTNCILVSSGSNVCLTSVLQSPLEHMNTTGNVSQIVALHDHAVTLNPGVSGMRDHATSIEFKDQYPCLISDDSMKDVMAHTQNRLVSCPEEVATTPMIDSKSTSCNNLFQAKEVASHSSNFEPAVMLPCCNPLRENSSGGNRENSYELKRNLTCRSPTVQKRQRHSLIADPDKFEMDDMLLQEKSDMTTQNSPALLFADYESKIAVDNWIPTSIQEKESTPKDPELKSMICIEHLSRKTYTKNGLPVWEFVVHGGDDDILYYFKAFAKKSQIPNAGYGAFLSFIGAKRLNKESKARNNALMEDAVYKSRLDNSPLDAIIDEKHSGVTVHLKGAGLDRHGRQYGSETSLKALIEPNSIIGGSVFRPGIQRVRIYIAGLPSIIDRKAYFVSDPSRRIGHLGIHLESDYKWIQDAIFPAFANCIDLGRYGPFHVEDRKTDELFSLKVRKSSAVQLIVQEWSLIFLLTKNFIFSSEPAQWDFEVCEKLDQSVQIIDITDDVTGKPRELAKCKIPMYVNEIGYIPSLLQNIYICEDCDRVVKYFFQSDQSLKEGAIVELLTNYRDTYESARERKGYGWRNLSEGLKGDDCTSQRMQRNFIDRCDVQNIIGFEMSLQKLSSYLDFVKCRIWIPLVELISSHSDNRTSKLSALQWIAVLRIQWLSNIFWQRIEKERAAATRDNLLSQLLVFKMTQALNSMPAENVDMEKPIFASILDVDGHLVGSAIKNEVIEEVCFNLHDKMPLLMDSSVYCPVGRDVIERLCMVVASSLRRKEHVNQDQKKEACSKFFRIAIEAAKQIDISAENFISDAENSSLLFSSGIGVKSYLCCPFQAAYKLLDETSPCYLDNTIVSKGFHAALMEKISYFDGLTVAGLEPGFDSISSRIEIEDWFCMTKFAGFSTHDDLCDLGSIPCSLSTRLRTSACINTTWYIVWQVLWPIHMFATEYLDENVYSLDALAMSLNVHHAIALFAVARGMSEQENSHHRVLQCCKPLIPFYHPRREPRNVCASLPGYATNNEKKNNQNSAKKQNLKVPSKGAPLISFCHPEPRKGCASLPVYVTSSEKKKKQNLAKTQTVKVSSKDARRIASPMVYEGPVKNFPLGVAALPGWIQRTFQRQSGASAGHVDHYWYTPQTKYKLRSYVEISRFLNALDANSGNEEAAIAAMK